MPNNTEILFKRDCFTGETLYISFEAMFPGGIESIADCYRNNIPYGKHDTYWVNNAYNNVRLLMLAGF